MKFAVQINKADNKVIGTWRGRGPGIPQPDDTETYIVREITESKFNEIQRKGTSHPNRGPLRWEFDGNNVNEVADARPILRFTPDTVDVATSTVVTDIVVEKILPNRTVDTSFTGALFCAVNGRLYRFNLTNGVGAISVNTDDSYEFSITACSEFRVIAPLSVRVFTETIRR